MRPRKRAVSTFVLLSIVASAALRTRCLIRYPHEPAIRVLLFSPLGFRQPSQQSFSGSQNLQLSLRLPLHSAINRRHALSLLLPSVAGASIVNAAPVSGSAAESSGAGAKGILEKIEFAITDALGAWETTLPPDGDSIRRVLGTIGSTSPLYGLSTALKALISEDPDLVEQTEIVEDVRRQADFLAYSSYYCGTNAGGGNLGVNSVLPGTPDMACGQRYLLASLQQMKDLRSEVQVLLRGL
eukprot:CAMPEP_0117523916 /NCGR_PEP_ID=MMETSP0784-20121206/34973_1 /TAXON_ID=39447 /ORGANISM="" /LENGTH=240 /DNA_ID=CAMNT_0005320041 /DNA_START=46 /DNA_END=768 /DNA_ORIENTATION=-